MVYTTYDSNGKILGGGSCIPSVFATYKCRLFETCNNFALSDNSNYETQKIVFDGFDEEGQPINPQIVDMSVNEIEAKALADVPTTTCPCEEHQVRITERQLQAIVNRITALEKKEKKNRGN